jgi:hypothetical protein
MKKLLFVFVAASLGGCATQFGTRIEQPAPSVHVVHHHKHRVVAKLHEPSPIAQPPVAPAQEPPSPKSFWERHPLKWLHRP